MLGGKSFMGRSLLLRILFWTSWETIVCLPFLPLFHSCASVGETCKWRSTLSRCYRRFTFGTCFAGHIKMTLYRLLLITTRSTKWCYLCRVYLTTAHAVFQRRSFLGSFCGLEMSAAQFR